MFVSTRVPEDDGLFSGGLLTQGWFRQSGTIPSRVPTPSGMLCDPHHPRQGAAWGAVATSILLETPLMGQVNTLGDNEANRWMTKSSWRKSWP
jgi:hypothetical protein